ncbi:MAG: molybdopterin-dependent oxidoreductase [Methanomicrobiales archaeon]|nr:molybdopterin-dependent oxidoreductase [Methanomicrobiales archaeon]
MGTTTVSGIALLCAALVLAGLLAGCLGGQQAPLQLSGVEVRDYQGAHLSSVNDFLENSIKGPQQVNITEYRLTIDGLVREKKSFTYDQVLQGFPHYKKVVTLFCVEGWDATILWEGVKVSDLINTAGPDPRANTVIFTGADGYTTSEPLDYINENNILLAYGMNNITMPVERGYPFELVAEDRWGYKWIRWVTGIRLSDDPTYHGYWESRGYSNTGDLNKSFFTD